MEIGIIGAGVMGGSIAMEFAKHEAYTVVLCDVNREYAERGVKQVRARLDKLVAAGHMDQAAADLSASRIRSGLKEDLTMTGMVIEAVVERMDVKRELFAALQDICPKGCLFTSNTSSLSITEVGVGLDRPVIGMHFFNPVHSMKLVEVIYAMHTPRELIEAVKDVASSIGKQPIEVQDSAGFVVNRILIPMINEAVGVLADGVSSAEEIDIAMQLGANHPMGPLALGDLIGLDVCLAIMEILYNDTCDPKYRPHALLRRMVRGGLLGRKTGRGFFDYPKK